MPSLRGFSARNLKNMRQFYSAYEHNPIGQLLTAQLQNNDTQQDILGQLPTAQLQSTHAAEDWSSTMTQIDNSFLSNFFSVTFTHHLILLNKCKALEERLFYMQRAAEDYWSVSILEHHIQENCIQYNRIHPKDGKRICFYR
jgi:hypothetical protein